VTDALSAAIAGEDAAIYAYGVIGPRLSGADLILAQQAEVAHRNTRDQFAATMPSPPAPEVVYALPFPVTDAAGALALAVTVEERCTALWRAAVAAAAPADRPTPLTVMIGTATRATAFRRRAGAFPGTVTFPGL
jgi:Domain of unknown function (DUF4439)